MSDLIIEGAKGIPDGLYVIKDGELFKYKEKGGTVRSYHITDRPRGKWIYWREDGIKRCKCSRCLTSYGCLDTPYCPNCGANMRGENE